MLDGAAGEGTDQVSQHQDKGRSAGWGIPLRAAADPARRRSLLKVCFATSDRCFVYETAPVNVFKDTSKLGKMTAEAEVLEDCITPCLLYLH